MEYVIDNFHCIGEAHIRSNLPCQDYSRTFRDYRKNLYVGAISDGCSGSLGDPSFGAAYLVNEFLHIAKSDAFHEVEGIDVKHTLLLSIRDMIDKGYSPDDFLATLIGIVKTKDNLNIFWFGDGCVIKEFKDGITEVWNIEYPSNAPYYLVYNANPSKEDLFTTIYGGEATLSKYWFNSEKEQIDGEVIDIDGHGMILDLSDEMDNLSSVTITSDGIDLLETKEGYLPLNEACSTVTGFKSIADGLVKRLCGFHFRRKKTIIPDDDYSQVSLCLR